MTVNELYRVWSLFLRCNLLVKTVQMVFLLYIYQFTMILLWSPRQGGSNGGQIIIIGFLSINMIVNNVLIDCIYCNVDLL